MKIRLQGSPEEIQRIADLLEQADPGAFVWDDLGEDVGHQFALEGRQNVPALVEG